MFRYGQSVVDLNPQVAHRAFNFFVSQQKLNCPPVASPAVNEGRFGSAHEFWPKAGGLLSYTFDSVDLHAQAASYIDRILKGASPADLPVQQPAKYSLIINLKTVKALGLSVPAAVLDLADEVIE